MKNEELRSIEKQKEKKKTVLASPWASDATSSWPTNQRLSAGMMSKLSCTRAFRTDTGAPGTEAQCLKWLLGDKSENMKEKDDT